ncbi:hypothetical protein [Streptosporangium sp. 'caverna']|uniref:hypothetical protein n=1 Tax=Streptosporangium sp. 'caverna' TaxID=2202249 RepID=UPI000D7D9514|nr:hypothetical protein [Streptosporangium sp. 'caverna']AWS44512.1 hypothetical protein DKM19_27345 [Streptosporangium sp. 'caverna']
MDTSTPFRAKVIDLRTGGYTYLDMHRKSQGVRSDSWWNSVALHGAWGGGPSARVAPPAPETFDGIAALFKVSRQEVQAMIAADWYGTQQQETSAAVRRLEVPINQLAAHDLDLVEAIVRRLVVSNS